MNPSYIVPIFLIIFILLMRERTQAIIAQRIIKRKRLKGLGEVNEMTELAKRFIGKDCVIYTYNGSQLLGKIEEVGESGIILRAEDGTEQLVNSDFILRLREHPIGKNGKKKSVILD